MSGSCPRERCSGPPSRPASTWSRSAPNAEPPVLQDPRFRQVQIRSAEEEERGQKKQKVIEIKEIKVRPNIDENDYQVKMRAMKSFIEEGDKVKVTLRFRGREMAHQEIGMRVLERIARRDGATCPRSSRCRGWKTARW